MHHAGSRQYEEGESGLAFSSTGRYARTMAELRLEMLGGFDLTADGQTVALRTRKARALLAILALEPGRAWPREKLAAMLWQFSGEEQARTSLRQTLSLIRKAVPACNADWLRADGDALALDNAALAVDVAEFERLAEEGGTEALPSAAALYGGDFLDGLALREEAFEEWLRVERTRLRDKAVDVLARLVAHHAEARTYGAGIDVATRLLALDPLREEIHRALMELYARTGRTDAALRQFQSCRDILERELAVGPAPETQALYEAILERRFAASGADAPTDSQLVQAATLGPTVVRLALPDKPSIAVLPFINMSGDPEQEYFADGITEDIITALSRYRWLLVISRYSAFAYKGQSADVRRVAAELDAGYVVEGSVRKAGNRVRITAQLVDGISGKHIWAERYDRDLEDVFALQDEMTETIVARIEPELGAVESQRAKLKPPQNLDAWDYYHLGLAHLYKFAKDDNAEARRLFHRSIEIDPDFAAAHAWFAYAIVLGMVYFDAEPEAEVLDDALHAAQKGVALDDQDALAHFALGRVHLARCEYDLAVAELETSIDLNPCLAQSHCGLGDALAYDGRLQDSILHFEEAIRLSPKDPYRWAFYGYRSVAHLFLKEHEAAAEWAGKAARIPNAPSWAKAHLVAALGHLGRTEEAHAALRDLLRQNPEYSCSFARKHLFYIKDPAQLDHYLGGLRMAGVPE